MWDVTKWAWEDLNFRPHAYHALRFRPNSRHFAVIFTTDHVICRHFGHIIPYLPINRHHAGRLTTQEAPEVGGTRAG